MSQELKTPDEKAKTDTSEAAADAKPEEQQGKIGKEHVSGPSYGSAAAFLGFRCGILPVYRCKARPHKCGFSILTV